MAASPGAGRRGPEATAGVRSGWSMPPGTPAGVATSGTSGGAPATARRGGSGSEPGAAVAGTATRDVALAADRGSVTMPASARIATSGGAEFSATTGPPW